MYLKKEIKYYSPLVSKHTIRLRSYKYRMKIYILIVIVITIKFYYFYYYLLLFIIHNFSIFFNIQKIILKQKNTKKKLSIL